MVTKVTVVDSIMGSYKSTAQYRHIRENTHKRYIYVTPFISELNRAIIEVGKYLEEGDTFEVFTKLDSNKEEKQDIRVWDKDGNLVDRKWILHQPTYKKGAKLNDFKDLLRYGLNIVTTHSLMSNFDQEVQELLEVGEYHLILDEVMDVIHQYKWSSASDKKTFFEDLGGVGEDNYLYWDKEKNPVDTYNGRFNDLMILCENRNLIALNKDRNDVYMWELPVNIFKVFQSITLLTFLFNGSYQKLYFDLYDVEYEFKSMKDGEIVDYVPTSKEEKERIKSLITIDETESINHIGENTYALTSTWMGKNVKEGTLMTKKLKNNLLNYFKNIIKSKSEENMWSCFKDYKKLLKGDTYTKGYVEFNTRATNEHKHRANLAYIVNIYPHTSTVMYFRERGILIDNDEYALSILLQWIWRSRIRDGYPINLYLPSIRMKNLLLNFLNDC